MANSKNYQVSHDSEPATEAVAITPSDGAILAAGTTARYPRALYIGVSGDVTVDLTDTGTSVLFKAVPVGILPIKVKRIYATGTTATNIVALY